MRDGEPEDLTYSQLLDLAQEFVGRRHEAPPTTFDAVRFWAKQPSFVAACQMAYHLGQEHREDAGWVHRDDIDCDFGS